MAAARWTSDEITGGHFALRVHHAAFKHVTLLDIDVLVKGEPGTGLAANQRCE